MSSTAAISSARSTTTDPSHTHVTPALRSWTTLGAPQQNATDASPRAAPWKAIAQVPRPLSPDYSDEQQSPVTREPCPVHRLTSFTPFDQPQGRKDTRPSVSHSGNVMSGDTSFATAHGSITAPPSVTSRTDNKPYLSRASISHSTANASSMAQTSIAINDDGVGSHGSVSTKQPLAVSMTGTNTADLSSRRTDNSQSEWKPHAAPLGFFASLKPPPPVDEKKSRSSNSTPLETNVEGGCAAVRRNASGSETLSSSMSSNEEDQLSLATQVAHVSAKNIAARVHDVISLREQLDETNDLMWNVLLESPGVSLSAEFVNVSDGVSSSPSSLCEGRNPISTPTLQESIRSAYANGNISPGVSLALSSEANFQKSTLGLLSPNAQPDVSIASDFRFHPALSKQGSFSYSKLQDPNGVMINAPPPLQPNETQCAPICANCGANGASAEMLLCSCRSVKYCCSKCQRADWKQHKDKCRKMRALNQTEHVACGFCGKESDSLQWCSCHGIMYCNSICQHSDWAKHSDACTFCPPQASAQPSATEGIMEAFECGGDWTDSAEYTENDTHNHSIATQKDQKKGNSQKPTTPQKGKPSKFSVFRLASRVRRKHLENPDEEEESGTNATDASHSIAAPQPNSSNRKTMEYHAPSISSMQSKSFPPQSSLRPCTSDRIFTFPEIGMAGDGSRQKAAFSTTEIVPPQGSESQGLASFTRSSRGLFSDLHDTIAQVGENAPESESRAAPLIHFPTPPSPDGNSHFENTTERGPRVLMIQSLLNDTTDTIMSLFGSDGSGSPIRGGERSDGTTLIHFTPSTDSSSIRSFPNRKYNPSNGNLFPHPGTLCQSESSSWRSPPDCVPTTATMNSRFKHTHGNESGRLGNRFDLIEGERYSTSPNNRPLSLGNNSSMWPILSSSAISPTSQASANGSVAFPAVPVRSTSPMQGKRDLSEESLCMEQRKFIPSPPLLCNSKHLQGRPGTTPGEKMRRAGDSSPTGSGLWKNGTVEMNAGSGGTFSRTPSIMPSSEGMFRSNGSVGWKGSATQFSSTIDSANTRSSPLAIDSVTGTMGGNGMRIKRVHSIIFNESLIHPGSPGYSQGSASHVTSDTNCGPLTSASLRRIASDACRTMDGPLATSSRASVGSYKTSHHLLRCNSSKVSRRNNSSIFGTGKTVLQFPVSIEEQAQRQHIGEMMASEWKKVEHRYRVESIKLFLAHTQTEESEQREEILIQSIDDWYDIQSRFRIGLKSLTKKR